MFDFFNFALLVLNAPFWAMFILRMLTPKVSRKRFFLDNMLYMTCMAALNVSLDGLVSRYAPTYFTYVGLVYNAIEITGYMLLWKRIASDSFGRRLLAYALSVLCIAVGYTVGMYLAKLLHATVLYQTPGLLSAEDLDSAFVMSFQSVVLFASSEFIARRVRRIAVDVRWSMFALLLTVQVMTFVVISGLADWTTMRWSSLMVLALYVAACVFLNVYVLRTFRSMVENAELEQQLALRDQQQRLERAQYLAVGEQVTGLRRLRHDYMNTLGTIGTLLRMGETERALHVLDDTASELERTRIVRTGNQIADAVLYSKTLSAAQKGVPVSCSLLWPQSLAIADVDLMRVLSNLLDNAVSYCESLPADAARDVTVTSALHGRMFALLVSNPFAGETPPPIPAPGDGAPTGEHGHGLAIVRRILESYGGTLTNECSEGRLTFRAALLDAPHLSA